MTSYGKFEDIQNIARVMIDALKYMLENTFEQKPEGGPELDFSGFPGWCMYVLAMYAQVRLPSSIGCNLRFEIIWCRNVESKQERRAIHVLRVALDSSCRLSEILALHILRSK